MIGARVLVEALVHPIGARELRVPRLVLEPGCAAAVQGPNGSGKSTLLRILAGLLSPAHGKLSIDRAPVTLLHQQPYLFRGTVLANVAFGPRARGLHRAEARRRAHQALDTVNAAPLANRNVVGLSGGEAQRVALARALAIEPALLLLDEPTTGLDPEGQALVQRLTARWRTEGGPTVLWATPEPLPDGLVDQVHVLGR